MKTKTLVYVLVIFVFGISTQYGIAGDFDWPRWRGPNGNGISMETDWNPEALAGGLKILWKEDIGMGHSNVAIKDGLLYTMGRIGKENVIFCLDADTGEEIWRYVFEEVHEPQSTPTTDGKYVYVLSKKGILVCLKVKNGKLRWKKNLVKEYEVKSPHYGFAGSPVIEDDLIILNTNISGVALDKSSGEQVWASERPPDKSYNRLNTSTGVDYSTPIVFDIGGKRCTAVSSYVGQYFVEVETGKLLWFYECPDLGSGCRVTDPLIFDNKVFIIQYTNENIGSVLLDIRKGEPNVLWKNKEMFSETSSPVIIDGYIYACQGGPERRWGTLRCLDIETGEMMWEENLKRRPISITAANRKLIILDEEGDLYIAEASPVAYQEISSCDVLEGEKKGRMFWTPPVLCNGKIYCRNNYGDLVCIDVSK